MFNLFYCDIFFLSFLILIVGLWGIIVIRSNILLIIMSLELIIFSLSLNLITTSIYLDDFTGQIFSIVLLSISACESSVGLALLINFYRVRGEISLKIVSNLKS